jgi:hypothetical protein
VKTIIHSTPTGKCGRGRYKSWWLREIYKVQKKFNRNRKNRHLQSEKWEPITMGEL